MRLDAQVKQTNNGWFCVILIFIFVLICVCEYKLNFILEDGQFMCLIFSPDNLLIHQGLMFQSKLSSCGVAIAKLRVRLNIDSILQSRLWGIWSFL